MNFEPARAEMRERFSESLSLLNYIRRNSPTGLAPLDDIQKTMRGLWIVSLYAAFERSTNTIVETALGNLLLAKSRTVDHLPSVHSILHHRKIQSLKNAGWANVIDKSITLFDSVFSETAPENFDNPLADKLQNVDGKTLEWTANVFGISNFTVDAIKLGRLNNLRERRNAVSHGRESASEVGQRFTLQEMNAIYNAADEVSTQFLLAMENHCRQQGYLRVA